MDKIEYSNLSRSVLFREDDLGFYKADVAAASANKIFPGMKILPLCVNAVSDLGLGWFYWADVIIGGLDNREARLSINRNAYRAGKPWIDGAIEVLNGVARVFTPLEGPCYECTMSEVDWKMLHARRACTLLNRDEMLAGKTPTTPTIASIIAGVQCQEAIKILHGMSSLSGKGYIFEGVSYDSYVVEYQRKADCYSHESFLPVTKIDLSARELSLADAIGVIQKDLGADAELEVKEEVLIGFQCSSCNEFSALHSSLGAIREHDSRCPSCGQLRIPETAHSFGNQESFADKKLSEIGIPDFDAFVGRIGEECRYYLLRSDQLEFFNSRPERSRGQLNE